MKKEPQIEICCMQESDYDQVKELWMSIKGFSIRSVDDSRDGVVRFLRRNPTTSVVAKVDGRVVGSILCGHDGRRAGLYHVCVREEYRKHGIGKEMVEFCLQALREEGVSKVSLVAFKKNDLGNAFWTNMGWTMREDLNQYDYTLNAANICTVNE